MARPSQSDRSGGYAGTELDRLAAIAVQAGARNVEGPAYEDEQYYAVFFEDLSGNRLEICYREVE